MFVKLKKLIHLNRNNMKPSHERRKSKVVVNYV